MADHYIYMDSPVGRLTLVASDTALVAILWEVEHRRPLKMADMTESRDHPVLQHAQRQLHEYFAGQRRTFDLPLEFRGTDFQKSVWQALLTIPYGETRSYIDIANQLGNPKAVRAVGAANGRNPISIIAPCHRVIGASGDLVGFGGGLPAKSKLLELEGYLPEQPSLF